MRPAPHLGVVKGRILSTEIQLVMALIFTTQVCFENTRVEYRLATVLCDK